MAGVRCFVAIDAGAEVQAAAAAFHATGATPGLRWEDPSKLHVTLKFLGNVGLDVLEALSRRLSDALRYRSSFDIIYEGLGAFPSFERPRIFWLGVRDPQPLIALQREVEAITRTMGFAEDERPFHPHITLARIRQHTAAHRLTATLKSLTLEPVLTRCTEVLLMKSELRPETSKYTVVQSIPLRS